MSQTSLIYNLLTVHALEVIASVCPHL